MTNLNQDMSAAHGQQSKDDGYRYWPDVGPVLAACFVREHLDQFIQRFAGVPASVVRNNLKWVAEQLRDAETAKALTEVVSLSGATGENDLRLRHVMHALHQQAADPELDMSKRELLPEIRDPLFWRHPDKRGPGAISKVPVHAASSSSHL